MYRQAYVKIYLGLNKIEVNSMKSLAHDKEDILAGAPGLIL